MEYQRVLGYDSYLENIEKIQSFDCINRLNVTQYMYEEKIKLEVVYLYYLGEY